MKYQTCIICEKKLVGYGNNALPIKEGRCCDRCNWRIVVPFRIISSQAFEKYRKDILEARGLADD